MRILLPLTCFLGFWILQVSPALSSSPAIPPEMLLQNMRAAYEQVSDYQTEVEIRNYLGEDAVETKRFLYTFKKPGKIRLDFESPHSGMIVVYPDSKGKVGVRLTHFFKLHLSPHDFFLRDPSGQRIDQTDLGLLIENIAHSLTDQSRGKPVIVSEDGAIKIRVLAADHFRKGVTTLYHFHIGPSLWLPTGVEESTPQGVLERRIFFRNLRINAGISDLFFRLDGE